MLLHTVYQSEQFAALTIDGLSCCVNFLIHFALCSMNTCVCCYAYFTALLVHGDAFVLLYIHIHAGIAYNHGI